MNHQHKVYIASEFIAIFLPQTNVDASVCHAHKVQRFPLA